MIINFNSLNINRYYVFSSKNSVYKTPVIVNSSLSFNHLVSMPSSSGLQARPVSPPLSEIVEHQYSPLSGRANELEESFYDGQLSNTIDSPSISLDQNDNPNLQVFYAQLIFKKA